MKFFGRKIRNPLKRKTSSASWRPLPRAGSVRGSLKKPRVQQGPIIQQNNTQFCGGFAALIILNSIYKPKEWGPLKGVLEDGKHMEEMLKKFGYTTEVVHDVEDIPKVVEEFCQKHKNKERLQFHYSGHGVHNANVEIDGVETTNWWKMTRTFLTATPVGDCLVSTSGELFSVHDLTHMLLKSNPLRATIFLDMCRDPKRDNRGRNKDSVKLRYEEEISRDDHKKFGMIYGTCELHSAMDDNSFTKELQKVVANNGGSIPILEITRKVNKSWEDRGIEQLCAEAFIQVGDNWTTYDWPDSPTMSNKDASVETGSQVMNVTAAIENPAETKRNFDEPTRQLILDLQAQVKSLQPLQAKVESLQSDVSCLKKRKTTLECGQPPEKVFNNSITLPELSEEHCSSHL